MHHAPVFDHMFVDLLGLFCRNLDSFHVLEYNYEFLIAHYYTTTNYYQIAVVRYVFFCVRELLT